jgi:hypothetical protein
LDLTHKDFKAAIITVFMDIKENIPEMNEKVRNLNKEI